MALFKDIHQARDHFRSYKPYKGSHEYLTYRDDFKLKFGEWFLFQHVSCSHGSKGNRISRPILAIFTGYDVWDMAMVVRFVESPRAFHYKNKIGDSKESSETIYFHPAFTQAEEIAIWSDNIVPIASWMHKPSISELKEALKKAE